MHPWNDTPMLLGKLLERSDVTNAHLGHIQTRLTTVDRALWDLTGRLASLESRPVASTTADTIGAIEKMTKAWAVWLIPLSVAWATGSLEQALKVASLLK